MNLTSDDILLIELRKGNNGAYDQLFLKYYNALCLHAYFLLKNEEEARELVQLFFVDLWEKKKFFLLEGSVKNYFYQSIKNRCMNHMRDEARKRRKQLEWEQHFSEYEDDLETSPSEDLFLLIDKAVEQLPIQRREALRLVYLQNKKYQEAAKIMGISVNSLKTHLKLGLKNLREGLNITKEA
ncbi:RNA polymerase sigma-70 factor, ECF subfamily [bacterium A37T11]|nr:RNA polymerase sigma-70 factor, ECF subfamily [bacterium A37T11]